MLLNFSKLFSFLSVSSKAIIANRNIVVKLKYLIIIAICTVTLPISSLYAQQHTQETSVSQSEQLKFSQLTALDGLSSSNVFSITQDHQGFLWFGTEDGLNRYDGNNIVIYRHNTNDNHSIADNVIRKIFIDSQNTLWVGTENGLSRYNEALDNFDTFKNIINDRSSLRDNVIWDIYQEQGKLIDNIKQNGLLWISTASGLHTLSLENKPIEAKFTRIEVRGHNNKFKEIKTIFQDKEQNYWLGSYDNGIHLISKNYNYIGSLQEDNKFDLTIDAQALFDIKTIDNRYWLATNNGLFIVDDDYQLLSHLTADKDSSKYIQPLLSNSIRTITQYNDTHVWLATHNGFKYC